MNNSNHASGNDVPEPRPGPDAPPVPHPDAPPVPLENPGDAPLPPIVDPDVLVPGSPTPVNPPMRA